MIVRGIKETKMHEAIQNVCRYQKRKRSTNPIKGITKVLIRVSPKIEFLLPLQCTVIYYAHQILRNPSRQNILAITTSTLSPTNIQNPPIITSQLQQSPSPHIPAAKAKPTTATAKAGNSLLTPALPVCCTGPSLVVEAAEPFPAAVELEGTAVTKSAATKLVVCVSSL